MPETPALDPAVEQLLDQWFETHFMGLGPLIDTPLYNRLYAAREALKQAAAAAGLTLAPAPEA